MDELGGGSLGVLIKLLFVFVKYKIVFNLFLNRPPIQAVG